MKIKILEETYQRLLFEREKKLSLIKEVCLLLEKEIEVGQGLSNKLKFANTSLSKKNS